MTGKIPSFKEQLASLIATPSVSSLDPAIDTSNRPVAALLAGWLEDLGYSVEMMQVRTNPDKVNLLAAAGRGEGGLVLAGHTDTVPYDQDRWRFDPFVLTESDNRYYGLGTSDMKSFFPIVLDVLRELEPARLKRPLFILATCDEECTMAGAKALVTAGRPLGRHALIGEPTGLKPVNMHKGIMYEAIRLIGKSGHSSDPALGINALEAMNSVINRLVSWRSELQGRLSNPLFGVPVSTVNFGAIHGGDNPNRICGECELKIDVRLLPGIDADDIRASLRRNIMETVDGTGISVEFDGIFPGLPAMETDKNSEIVRLAEKLAGEPACAVGFGTEGPYLNSLGMDTVVLGAGDIDVAHQPDEFLPLDRITPMKKIIQQMIEHFCLR